MASCSNLNHIADPVEKCEYAKQYCQVNSVIPFGDLIFCRLSSTAPRAIFLVTCAIWVFGAIGVAAFDHLSPNSIYLAEMSGLSQSLMGVTVLAFGNGSVDVFGALVALNANEGGMAFGEITGGALFVVTVVIGSMAIVKPFGVDREVFLRDIIFLAFSIAFTLLIARDGVITVIEALIGLASYSMYAVFVVHQHFSKVKQTGHTGDIETQNFFTNATDTNEVNNRDIDLATPNSTLSSPSPEPPVVPIIRPSLVASFELNRRVHKYLHEVDVVIPSPLPPEDPDLHIPNRSNNSNDETLSAQGTSHGSSLDNTLRHMRRRSSAPDLIHPIMSPESPSPFATGAYRNIPPLPAPQIIIRPASEETSHSSDTLSESTLHSPFVPEASSHNSSIPKNQSKLLPPLEIPRTSSGIHKVSSAQELRNFSSFEMDHIDLLQHEHHRSPLLMKDMIGRLIENQKSPISPLVMRSAVDCDENEGNQSSIDCLFEPTQWWVCMFPISDGWKEQGWIQRIGDTSMLPLTTILAWSIPSYRHISSRLYLCMYSVGVPFSLPLIISGLNVSSTVIVVQIFTAGLGLLLWGYFNVRRPPPLLAAALGFMMALFWVMFLATELVSILTLLGVVSHISSTIMGLTVFALGDSLGDFVANITIAKIGYPAMAIAACFGGPIFTSLVGISGASLITMLRKHELELHIPISRGLMISCSGLLIALAFLAFSAKRNQYVITKITGSCLLAIWFMVVTLSTLL